MGIFADAENVEIIDVPFELPVIDPRTGHVDARFGEPYLSPLMLAFDQFERFFVVLIGRDRCRTFEAFLGEIEELKDSVRGPTPGDWDRLQSAQQTIPAYLASRDNAAKDRAERHLWQWV